MPWASMEWKNRLNRCWSEVFADSKSMTSRSVKNNVNMEPTRFTRTGTPALAAASGSIFFKVAVAAVQLDPARPASTEELRQLVAESLATYKHLRHVVDAIPRLPSGKVLRRTLRDELSSSLLQAAT